MHYRKFIPNFAAITIPLNKLLRKDAEFKFDENCRVAFEALKRMLISPQILQYPDFEHDFILRTDASGFALGAVLSNFNDRPIAYASKTLNGAEKNYSTIEKELLAIVWSVKHYRPYLFGRRFKILTDHRPLIYLFSMKEPSSRLTKFRLLLEEYNFSVEYSPGKENTTADALSRITLKSQELQQLSICVATRSFTRRENERKKDSENQINTEPTLQELLKPPEIGLKTTEIKIVSEFDEEFNKIGGANIVMGPNKVLAYIPERNVLIWRRGKDSTNAQKSIDGSPLIRDAQKICTPLEIKYLYIKKKELVKLSDGRPSINNLKKYINELFKESDIRIIVIYNVINIEDPEEKKIIMNDLHILPYANRMVSKY